MRCEDVRRQLEDDAPVPELREALVAHIADCFECGRVQLAFEQVDETLQRGPLWEPPEGFAARVAAQAPDLIGAQTHRIQAHLTRSLTIAASVVFVVVFGYLWLTSPGQPAVAVTLANEAAAAIEAYEQFVGDLAQALVVSSGPLAWASAALSLALGTWFTRRALA